MDKSKLLLQVLQEHVFMDTSKYIGTYYTLRGWEYNYGNKILENYLMEMMRNCLDFIE